MQFMPYLKQNYSRYWFYQLQVDAICPGDARHASWCHNGRGIWTRHNDVTASDFEWSTCDWNWLMIWWYAAEVYYIWCHNFEAPDTPLTEQCHNKLIVAQWCHVVTWMLVNIGSDYGSLPDSTKPLHIESDVYLSVKNSETHITWWHH